MFEYTIKMLFSALHYSTWSQEGFRCNFSSCMAPNYLILMSEHFKCVPGTPRIPEVVRSGPGVQK